MDESNGNNFLYTNVGGILRKTVKGLLYRVQEQRRHQLLADRHMVKNILASMNWDDPEVQQYWKSEYENIIAHDQETPINKSRTGDFFPHMMGKHLLRTLRSLPLRNLTSLIIDGTGVDTMHMNLILNQYPKLRGISVRGCPNFECSLWADWLLEQMYWQRPISLQWLRVSDILPHLWPFPLTIYSYGPQEMFPLNIHVLNHSRAWSRSIPVQTTNPRFIMYQIQHICRDISSPTLFPCGSISHTLLTLLRPSIFVGVKNSNTKSLFRPV